MTPADNRKRVCTRVGGENTPLNDGCESLGVKRASEAHTRQLWAGDNRMESQQLKVIHAPFVVRCAAGGDDLLIFNLGRETKARQQNLSNCL